jgi:hypothetical protein
MKEKNTFWENYISIGLILKYSVFLEIINFDLWRHIYVALNFCYFFKYTVI